MSGVPGEPMPDVSREPIPDVSRGPASSASGQPASGGGVGHDYQPSYWTPTYATTHLGGAQAVEPTTQAAALSTESEARPPREVSSRPATADGVGGAAAPAGAAAGAPRDAAPAAGAPTSGTAAHAQGGAPASPPLPPQPPLIARVGMDVGPRQVDFPAPQDTLDLSPHMTGMSAMPGWQPRRRPGAARVLGPLAALATFAVFGLVATHMAGAWGGNPSDGSAPGGAVPAGIESEAADPQPTQDPNGQDADAQDSGVSGVQVGDLSYQPRGLTCGRRALSLLPSGHAALPTGRQWCVLDVTVQPGDGAGSAAEGPDPSDATLRDARGHRWTPDSDTTSADDADSVLGSPLQQVATVHYWFVVDNAARPTAVTFTHQGETSATLDLD